MCCCHVNGRVDIEEQFAYKIDYFKYENERELVNVVMSPQKLCKVHTLNLSLLKHNKQKIKAEMI